MKYITISLHFNQTGYLLKNIINIPYAILDLQVHQ